MGVESAGQLLQTGIRISEPLVLVGLLIGGSIPWLFSALTINAVSRAASLIVVEVRRQFKLPGLMEGKTKPDYGKAVGICTVAAQKELVGLAAMAVLIPLLVGLGLRVEALGGFLGGVILSGQLLAVFMANAGGAWDNAKKLIEDGNYGGRGSAQHKAAIVGDTVGDPLKDTAGPALNPMIKVINLVSVLAAPLLIQFRTITPGVVIFLVAAFAAIIVSIWYSKRTARPRRS